jgi:ComF family protein
MASENSIEKLCKYCGFDTKHCKCGSGIYYDRAFTCYTYDGLARKGVLSLKNSNNLNFAYHVGDILSEYISVGAIRYDVIVPIPMHFRKRLKRGYNQAEVISKRLAKRLDIPIETSAIKVKYTKTVQHSLSRKDRLTNAKSLYSQGTADVRDKYIILVDDIMTTGSTLNVCSNLLHGMGAKSVIVAVATSDQIKSKEGKDV